MSSWGKLTTSPKFERKPIYWTLSEIARRLGPDVYQTFTEGRTQHEWVKYLHAKTKARNPEMPDYEEMKTTLRSSRKMPGGTLCRLPCIPRRSCLQSAEYAIRED